MPTTAIIRPNGQGAGNDNNWTLGAGASKVAAVSDDNPATYVTPVGTTAETYDFANVSASATSLIASVVLTAKQQANLNTGISLRARLNGVVLDTPLVTPFTGGGFSFQAYSYNFPRPGGGLWSIADVNATQWGWAQLDSSDPGGPDGTDLEVAVTYTPTGVQLEPPRLSSGREVLRRSTLPDRLAVTLPPQFLALELLQEVELSHSLIPTADGQGHGFTKAWQRLLARIYSYEVDPGNLAQPLQIRAESLREYLHAYMDGGISPREPSGLLDGVLLIDNGSVRTYDGPTAVVKSPVSGLLVQVADDVEPTGVIGRQHEPAATNRVLQSAFRNGLTGWTPTGAGTTVETSPLAFDPAVSSQHVRMILGGGGTENIEQGSITANTGYQWLSIEHQEEVDASDITQVRIQRASDSNYWNGSAWQAGSIFLDLLNRPVVARDSIGPIDQTAGNTTYTIRIKPKATGDSSRVSHVQLELSSAGAGAEQGWPSSHIVTEGAAVTRGATSLKVSNNSSARVLDAVRGTYLVRLKSFWASANITTELRYVFACEWDSNNKMELLYRPATGVFRFMRTAGGSVVILPVAKAISRNADVDIALTWQATDGENGDADYTFSMTTDGLTQAKAVSSALTMTSTADLFRGSDAAGARQWGGAIWDEHVLPSVLSLAEIRRWMKG